MSSRPTGEVIPDLKRKLPGRGLWVSASRQAVAEAVRRNQFGKGFKREVRVAATLAADTEALLVRGVIEALAMAAKAGQVVSGFSKVEGALRRGRRGADPCLGRRRGQIRKLDAIVRQNAGINDEFGRISGGHGADLGTIGFGTRPVKCDTCCVLAGPASKTFLSRSQILVRYRMADDDRTAGNAAKNFAETDCADTHDATRLGLLNG